MTVQISLADDTLAPHQDVGHAHRVAPDIAYLRTVLVNVVFLGTAENWVLVDTGIPGSGDAIRSAADDLFGAGARPKAIILTHGHFDHVGALESLSREWDVPVFAHPLEHTFLSGGAEYPPPDTHADGGLMPKLAPLFPRSPVDVSERLEPLPADGSVPHAPGWQWLHTPGHTPGHVSLWRQADSSMIAGDAFITTGQESAYEIAVQEIEMHGPPRYFTPDWIAAERSVRLLAEHRPRLVVTGHGRALAGPEMLNALTRLAQDFNSIALPEHLRDGR